MRPRFAPFRSPTVSKSGAHDTMTTAVDADRREPFSGLLI